jgi:hypothetical protein
MERVQIHLLFLRPEFIDLTWPARAYRIATTQGKQQHSAIPMKQDTTTQNTAKTHQRPETQWLSCKMNSKAQSR